MRFLQHQPQCAVVFICGFLCGLWWGTRCGCERANKVRLYVPCALCPDQTPYPPLKVCRSARLAHTRSTRGELPPPPVHGNNNQESQELAPLRCSNKARNTLPLITRHAGADRGLGTGPPPVVRRGAPSEDARGRGPTRGLLRLDVARLALVVLLGEHGHDHLPAVDLCRRVDDADARVDEVRLRSGSRLT